VRIKKYGVCTVLLSDRARAATPVGSPESKKVKTLEQPAAALKAKEGEGRKVRWSFTKILGVKRGGGYGEKRGGFDGLTVRGMRASIAAGMNHYKKK